MSPEVQAVSAILELYVNRLGWPPLFKQVTNGKWRTGGRNSFAEGHLILCHFATGDSLSHRDTHWAAAAVPDSPSSVAQWFCGRGKILDIFSLPRLVWLEDYALFYPAIRAAGAGKTDNRIL
jgi:hypothetical protein